MTVIFACRKSLQQGISCAPITRLSDADQSVMEPHGQPTPATLSMELRRKFSKRCSTIILANYLYIFCTV